MSIITVGTVAATFLVDFYWQQTRNEILLRYEKATITKSFPPSCGSKNRKGIETQLRNGQPGESSLQRHPCRIYSRRRVTEARNPDEDEQNYF
ncbi:hypothetical protein T02_7434, partial [Trichinella nativa]